MGAANNSSVLVTPDSEPLRTQGTASEPGRKRHGAMVILAVVMIVSLLGSLCACTTNLAENKLMTTLGYTEPLLTELLKNKTTLPKDFSSYGSREAVRNHEAAEYNENLDKIINALPLQSFRELVSYSLTSEPCELVISYVINDNFNRPEVGNGLNPFYEVVGENNALLLFAAIDGLERITLLSYDNFETGEQNSRSSYTIADLAIRFGSVNPRAMDIRAFYDALGSNIHISEWYFAHLSRIYLGTVPEEVSYRMEEPDEIQLSGNFTVWVYGGDSKEDPQTVSMYYFSVEGTRYNAERGLYPDAETGLYATRFIRGDHFDLSGDDIMTMFGLPAVTEKIAGKQYIAYALTEEGEYAYFILQEDKVLEEGIMFGTDYSALILSGAPLTAAG